MKQVKVKIETIVETTIDGKPVNEILKEIADLCHGHLEYSTSKNELCSSLYEEKRFQAAYNTAIDRVSILECTLCKILDLLED